MPLVAQSFPLPEGVVGVLDLQGCEVGRRALQSGRKCDRQILEQWR